MHGNEVMAESILDYDGSRDYRSWGPQHPEYSCRRSACGPNAMAWIPRSILGELASYAILDGLIGNTDRHHENWMFFYHPELQILPTGAFLRPRLIVGSGSCRMQSRRVSRSRRAISSTTGRVLNYLRGGGSPTRRLHQFRQSQGAAAVGGSAVDLSAGGRTWHGPGWNVWKQRNGVCVSRCYRPHT